MIKYLQKQKPNHGEVKYLIQNAAKVRDFDDGSKIK